MLKVENLTVEIGGKDIIQDINLEIKKEKWLSFLALTVAVRLHY